VKVGVHDGGEGKEREKQTVKRGEEKEE